MARIDPTAWSRQTTGGTKVRRLTVLAALAATFLAAAPVSAAPPTKPYLKTTAPDAAGCTGVEIWGQEGWIMTLAPWDGTPTNPKCAVVGQQKMQALTYGQHRLVFTWRRWECCFGIIGEDLLVTYIWTTSGTLGSTALFLTDECSSTHNIRFVNHRLLVSLICGPGRGTEAFSAIATSAPGLGGWDPGAGTKADGSALPLFVQMKQRIAYAANEQPFGDKRNRELWVSNTDFDGSTTMVDIKPGPDSSFIRDLVSHGSYATFTANDGHGRANWVTDGTVKGTHKVQGSS